MRPDLLQSCYLPARLPMVSGGTMEWKQALAAFGGLAAIGGLIDLAMYRSEKDKLKALLEDWWLRFIDLKWSNFGRVEAEIAVQILDRWAGPKFWSWKRWRFAAIVAVLVCLLAILWTVVRPVDSPIDPTERAFIEDESALIERVLIKSSDPLYNLTVVAVGPLAFLPASIVAFALSLSLTRFMAICAAQLCRNALLNGLSFALLLILHIILLLYWSAVVMALEALPYGLGPLLSAHTDAAFSILRNIFQEALPKHVNSRIPSPDWGALFSFRISHPSLASTRAFKIAMDIIANGLRILFALMFLSSFVFRPLIQEPLSRLWYGAMNSGKPIFTMMFGAAGAIVAIVQILMK